MEDTIKPRLLEAGADCNRVLVIDESIYCLSMTVAVPYIFVENIGYEWYNQNVKDMDKSGV